MTAQISAIFRREKNVNSQTASAFPKWRDMSLRIKLPIAFLGFTFASVLSIMAVTAALTKASQMDTAEETFVSAISGRADQLDQWFESTEATLLTMAAGKQTIDAIYTLSSTFKDIKGDARAVLQKAYLGDNPHPSDQRYLLDRGEGSEIYHAEHGKFHKTFRTMMLQNDLHDVFLINRDGDIVYSVSKEPDFGENLVSGPFAKSNLAKVYQSAREAKSGDVFLSDFEIYNAGTGGYSIFLTTPVVSDMGVTVGVLAVQLPDDGIENVITAGKLVGSSTEVYVLASKARAITPSRFEGRFEVGSTVKELPHVVDGLSGNSSVVRNVELQSGNIGSAYTHFIQRKGAQWLLVAERDNDDIFSGYYELLSIQLLVGLGCILLTAGLGIIVSRSLSVPISKMNLSVQGVAAGNYDLPVPYTGQKDEVGMIATSIEDMRSALAAAKNMEIDRLRHQNEQTDVVSRLTEALKGLSNGDLSKTIDDAFGTDYEVLRGYYNETVGQMRDSIQQIAGAAEGIRAQSGEITRASEELAHRTEVQAATLEQTAAAMDEMTASVKSAAHGVKEVETIVSEARKDADDCGAVVKEAVTAMAAIEKSSDQISQIIGVIDDIAFQTNLLALNAGVEAARAGDAGRGFAVVASEVGALAQRASNAAKEIKTLIGTSSEHVERGVERVKHAGTALHQIAKRVTQISSLTTNIATGASEQAIGLNEINIGVTQLDQATQKNAAMAEEANAASQLMANGAEELAVLVARFKLSDAQDLMRSAHDIAKEAPVFEEVIEEEVIEEKVAVGSGANAGLARFLPPSEPSAPRALAANARGVWQDF
jgi:methyl-accepting chemotaxis protein